MGFPVTIPGGSTWTADDFEPFTYPTSFPEIINEFVTYAESTEAVVKAGEAAASATAAAASQTAAAGSATTASTGATTATTKAGEASASATAAAGSASAAAGSATAAAGSATTASTGASTATSQAAISTASAVTSTAAKDAALVAQAAASASAVGAATSETNAAASAAAAGTSAALAAASAGVAGSGPATTLLYPALSKIVATATDIVDEFIYDCRLDSDGGAWRGKCEHTSWYQETLNTATRGATRPFPLVAKIVVRSGTTNPVAIYDMTDLDTSGIPRMWMIFPGGAFATPLTGATSAFALNGRVYFTINNAGADGRLIEIDFLVDRIWRTSSVGRSAAGAPGIANRALTTVGTLIGAGAIVSAVCNHVHARVLPGAQLDAAGLPIPTVLVSTAAGASVIHPNGAVYDITVASGYAKGVILPDARLMLSRLASDVVEFGPTPYADIANSSWRTYFAASNAAAAGAGAAYRFAGVTGPSVVPGAIASTLGLTMLAEDAGNPTGSMVSVAAISYATGWQPGGEAIRLATLCDATTGNITGSNVVNDTGASTTDWTLGTGWTHDAANTEFDHSSGTDPLDRAISPLVVGQTYSLVVTTASRTTGTATISMPSGGTLSGDTAVSTDKAHLMQFVATATSAVVRVTPVTGYDGSVTALKVDLAAPDRSYRNKPLVAVGTLSRTAVATGSDMVAFSGFSNSNYLTQPYNSDLDFGTGDFDLVFKAGAASAANIYLGERAFYTGGAYNSSPSWRFIVVNTGQIRFQASADGFSTVTTVQSATGAFAFDGALKEVRVTRRSGSVEVRLDGVVQATGTFSGTLTNTSASLILGAPLSLTGTANGGSMSMVRASAYAPTPAQIAKAVRDEAPLLQPGVKCLLGGTSNAVADMDFDTARNVLVVGTADGVSEFSGLVRTAYFDTSVLTGVLTNDNMRAVASQAGFRGLAGGAQSVAYREAVNGLDAMNRYGPRFLDRFVMRAVTTDATPTNLAPRIHVGEREVVRVKATVTARQNGASGTERASYDIVTQAYRDAGGNVTLDIAAANQGVAGWGTGGPAAITRAQETTSTMDAVWVVDTASQTLTVQVTGKAATRLEWTASNIVVERITNETLYAPIAA